jgi:hypothetical protein
MNPLTPKQARTLRVLTKDGKLQSFATSLVDDAHSRSLRSLVDIGYLTYEYTGTQRIYTLTEACGSQFPVPLEGKAVAKKKSAEAAERHTGEGHKDRPADRQGEDRSNSNVPSVNNAELCRGALAAGHESAAEALSWAKETYPELTINDKTFKVAFGKIKKEHRDDSAPTPPKNDEPDPTPRKSKPSAAQADSAPPTLTDLLAVGEMAAQHGGAKKLLGLVALVDGLARKVGGIDRLRGSLEGLETLAKLFK